MDFLKSVIPALDNGDFARRLGDSAQLQLLHDIVNRGIVSSDSEAEEMVYGSKRGSNAYKKLKQRLRDRVTEYIVQNGVTNKSLDEYAKLYRKCMNRALAVKTLMLSYARPAGAYIAENLIKTTIGNEYTDLTVLLGRELVYYYSAINFQAPRRRKYEAILLKAHELYSREIEVNRFYCDLRVVFNTSRGSINEEVLSRAISYCNKIEPYLDSTNTSYQLLIDIYEIFSMRYEMAQEYDKMLEISEMAIQTFANRKVSRKYAFFRFDMNKVICYIQYGQNDKVEALANRYFEEMTYGAFNWFVLKIYVLVSRLHCKKYQEAWETVNEMTSNKNYIKLPGTLQQTLIVYEAHVEFLIAAGKIRVETQSRFRLYKFLNEIPIYTKDKKGLNVSILIVHVLFLLQQKKYSKIIDRVDALNQYCHRHLRRDETFRSNCFIKMLLQLAKGDFNRKRVERYAYPYLMKLNSTPLRVSDQSIEVEVIPYEHLWDMVLELLGDMN